MDKKGDAHEDIYLLFQLNGVPPKMIVEGPKEQSIGVFKRKVVEAGCHLSQTKLEPLWQMSAKGGIHELKIGSGRNMTKMN